MLENVTLDAELRATEPPGIFVYVLPAGIGGILGLIG